MVWQMKFDTLRLIHKLLLKQEGGHTMSTLLYKFYAVKLSTRGKGSQKWPKIYKLSLSTTPHHTLKNILKSFFNNPQYIIPQLSSC